MSENTWTVYLSGEIHSDWRVRLRVGVLAFETPQRTVVRYPPAR
jgi:hypothetical protein